MKLLKLALTIALIMVGIVAPAYADYPTIIPQATFCFHSDTTSFTAHVTNIGTAPGKIGYTRPDMVTIVGRYIQHGTVVDLGYFEVGETRSFEVPQAYWGGWTYLTVSYTEGIWFWNGQTVVVTALYDVYGKLLNKCDFSNAASARTVESVEALALPCYNGEPLGMATFTRTTPLYWKADVAALVGLDMQEGQTAKYMQVQDDFVQIIWACSPLWVQANDVTFD